MTKLRVPRSRLICLGSARLHTNAIGEVGESENYLDYEYDPG